MNTQIIPHQIGKAIFVVLTILFVNMITGIAAFKNLNAGETPLKTQTEVKNISPKQAKELKDKAKDVFVLDVRSREEYDEVHIKDANLIPIQELEQNINKIPKDKKVIVHCAAGKRSAKACEILKDKGLKELYNLEGGINKWQAEGYPVEKP
ncbi:MAG: rhodanese-like domain-containing protein [Candidatus Brocadiales bacterium]|uniref:rhodanese-like domain-containing protein n=1 Tax=Candidatus Wunengus sp. YC60 TaxID=3367697 RepID=UPI0027132C44|nr:rhodanese-like domain-containing protein [Candidatus Brocadiales bacterium]